MQLTADTNHTTSRIWPEHKCTTKCTTKAFFVPDLQSDLLGGRALVTANYRVILDKDPKVSGIFPVTNGEIDPATGLPFMHSSEGLFFVETVSYYHYLKRNSKICQDTLYGIGNLVTVQSRQFEIRYRMQRESRNYQRNPSTKMSNARHVWSGKLTLKIDRCQENTRRTHLYMDMMSSATPSIEGNNYALVITDDASMYRWVYGLKEKSDSNAAAQKWICDIASIRARHVLQILIRDNAGELKVQISAHILNLWV